MVFSSPVFLFYFLPFFLICYLLLPQKNFVLLIFSLFFYAWGEGLFVLLMIASGLGNFYAAKLISQKPPEEARKILIIGVALNLLALIVFKYTGFLIETWNSLAPKLHIRDPHVHLPIGISFFTFHAISYLVDVYRGDFRPNASPSMCCSTSRCSRN